MQKHVKTRENSAPDHFKEVIAGSYVVDRLHSRMLVVDSNKSWEKITFDSIMDYRILLLNDEIQRPCTPGVYAYTALTVPSAPKAECSLLVPTFEV
ncbi:hypothetical protein D5086_031594 [Populus alba]|uniref:Uncharacterized protein n=1 Tax=Populus alba TaxID=43335 RepID=A0ACC4AJN6_POPAL